MLFSLSMASPLARRVNQNEHVILSNCLDASSHKYSEMAYFSATPQPGIAPDAIVLLNLPDNTYAAWDTQTVSGQFSDGDTFTSSLTSTNIGGCAGPGSNKFGGFNCFHQPVNNMYIDGAGTPIPLKCSQVYDCSHASVPVAKPQVEFFLNSALAQFDGTAVTAADFFNPIYQHMNNSACDQQAVDISNTGSSITGAADCTITFSCNGAGPDGRMITALANTLTQVIATLPDILVTKEVSITPYCIKQGPVISTPQGSYPSACLQYSGSTKTVSYIKSDISMDIVNYFEGGNLEYSINCPAPPQCRFCDDTATELNDASKVPVIGALFSVGELINYASCKNSNCPEPI